jgi:hypothetical protein
MTNTSMPNTLKIATYLLLASIATIFINGPMVLLFFKVNDLLLLGSLLILLVGILRKDIVIQQDKKIFIFFIVWFCFNIIGTIITFLLFEHVNYAPVLKEFSRMVACFLVFIEISTITKHVQSFIKWAIWSLIIPSIILPLIYFVPQNAMHYLEYVNGEKIRFTGLFENPNAYSQFMIIPIILILFYISKSEINNRKTLFLAFLGFFFSCLSVGTIIWSGSRSGILGLIAALSIFIFILAKSTPLKKIILKVILLIFLFPIGYFVLPNSEVTHKQIISRLEEIKTVGGDGVTKETRLFTGAQDRSGILVNSLKYIVKNPLGYGPEFSYSINITDNYGKEHMGSHNIILQLVLTGGILLLILSGYALFKILQQTFIIYRWSFTEINILIAILLGIIVSSLFSDYLYARWLWVILALIYSYTYKLPLTKIGK